MTSSVMNSISFQDVCLLLEKLFKKKNRFKDQHNILKEFFNDIKLKISKIEDEQDKNIFPLMRLLLPQLERERNAYNIKEARLAQILITIIPLHKQSQDGKNLLKWKAECRSKDGDFAGEAYYVLKNKATKSNNLTIGDINTMLDKIASNDVESKKQNLEETFYYALKNLNADQLKWFFRIILKDLKCGIGDDRILAALHPDAPQIKKSLNNLLQICKVFDGTNFVFKGAQLMFHVKPMLSKELDVTKLQLLPTDKMYQIEEKFDGERFQVHMDNGVFKYWSRNSHDFTKNYGETYAEGLITPHLKYCFREDVTSFILDGEMMGWHKKEKRFGSKAEDYNIKTVTENAAHRPCFCAFDIIYYNGKSIFGLPEKGGLPLKDRLKLLGSLFKDIPGVIHHSEVQPVQKMSDISDALHNMMRDKKEGIVVKNIDSYYIPDSRNDGWYKIKAEYTEGAMTDLDFVIIGADDAANKTHGKANTFLLACLDNKDAGENDRRWLCVGRVSTGLTNNQCEYICMKLQSQWFRTENKPPPEHLVFNKSKPDYWVLPENSIVFQVRASELERTTQYATSHTLRFPRVLRVREDKPVEDIMTLEEFYQLIKDNKGTTGSVVKLNKERIPDESIQSDQMTILTRKRRSRVKVALQVDEQFKTANIENVEIISKALLGRKIRVLSDDDDCPKTELYRIIASHSGINVVIDEDDIWCCVGGKINLSVQAAIKTQDVDLATTAWLRNLPPSENLCSLTPLDMLSMNKSTKLKFARDYDCFGDSYTVPTDEVTLKRCFDRIDDDDMHLTIRELRNLHAEIFENNSSPYSFLRNSCILFVNCDDLTIILAKMYGALVGENDMVNLTHVVVSTKTNNEEVNNLKEKYEGTLFVSEFWLESCFSQQKYILEHDFNI